MIRHAESVANLEQRFTLGEDEPLTARGIQQARATAEQVLATFRPVVLYSSPYRRALQTAQIIGAAIDLEPVVMDSFREQDFGDLKGEPYASYFGQGPIPVGEVRWRRSPPGGESLEAVARRAGPILDDLARRHRGEEVVIVSHGGVMAALRAHVAGHFGDAPLPTVNAGGFLLEVSDSGYRGPSLLFAE